MTIKRGKLPPATSLSILILFSISIGVVILVVMLYLFEQSTRVLMRDMTTQLQDLLGRPPGASKELQDENSERIQSTLDNISQVLNKQDLILKKIDNNTVVSNTTVTTLP